MRRRTQRCPYNEAKQFSDRMKAEIQTYNISSYLLDGDFITTAPDQKRAGDIIYLCTGKG